MSSLRVGHMADDHLAAQIHYLTNVTVHIPILHKPQTG